jgi:hypothetical protein
VGPTFSKPHQSPATTINGMKSRSAAAADRGKMNSCYLFSRYPMRLSCMGDTIKYELGNTLIIAMLDLTPTAAPEVPARRQNMMRTVLKRSIRQHDIAGCGTRHMPAVLR